jgi:hypothetical protein
MTEPTNIVARDSKGRFAKGTKTGGRLPRVKEDAYLEVTFGACSEEDWAAIIRRIVVQAKKGSVKSAEFLAKYLLPRPAPRSSTPLVNLNFAGGAPMPTTADIDTAINDRIRELFGVDQNVIDVTPIRDGTEQ